MVKKELCQADNGVGGRCNVVALKDGRCSAHADVAKHPASPAPDRVIFRFDGVSEQVLDSLGIPKIRRSAEKELELYCKRKDEVDAQGLQSQAGEMPKSGVNPFGEIVQNGTVGGALAELLCEGLRLTDLHALSGQDRRGRDMWTLVATLAVARDEGKKRDVRGAALVVHEAAQTRSFFVCVNPCRDGMVMHTVNCRKPQLGMRPKTRLGYAGGMWSLEPVATTVS